MRRKIRALERVLQLFAVPNAKARAFELVTGAPTLLGTGITKLFLSIRVLRALHFRPEDVDRNTAFDMLLMNTSDVAIALPDVIMRGLSGKEALQELQKAAAERRKVDRPEDSRRTQLRGALQELSPDSDVPSASISDDSADEIVKILRRAITLEESRNKRPVTGSAETSTK